MQIISQVRQSIIKLLANSMFDSEIYNEDEPFSAQLMYSLTAECFTMTEMRHLHEQTELLRQIASQREKASSTRISSDDEKEVDETRSQLETSIIEETQEKVTLLADCKIRRTQEEDDVLAEIQKKCSSNCYFKVKEAFEGIRQQSKALRQLENEIELNRKINTNLLHFKEENDYLRTELERVLSVLNSKQEEERQRMKVLEEKNMNKETAILKSEKSLLLKEKRIMEMKKKVQAIYDTVEREVTNITAQIDGFASYCAEANKQNEMGKDRLIDEKKISILKMWEQFGSSFKSRLQ